ncbi:MAG: cytochrome P450 [Candidatus Hydrogenedentes bacterium]|nr:cytochrome P450 [Candidatus Hydrogenedentota bacterium]
MSDTREPDWDLKAAGVLRDQRAVYDTMRERCPVAYSESLQWSVFRHEDVMRVLSDHETFSSTVSEHLSVPSGMDPPEHTAYRAIVERYFSSERIATFEPICRNLVVDLVQDLLERGQVELVADFALPFAARAQCAFLGWPSTLQEPLIRWTQKNHAATFAQNRKVMSEIAREFEGLVDELIEDRLEAGAKADDDITASLMHDTVWGRPLSHEDIASILRNWTVGEIGTISAAVGILAHYLAEHADLQSQLRAEPSLLPAAIDEILRIHGPLVANRRVTTRPVEINGRQIDAGERVSLMWISANRDGRAFDEPDCFCFDREVEKNLLYGAGLHVCPGAPLARLEMRVWLEELLARTDSVGLVPGTPPRNAVYPGSGFAKLPLLIQ